MNRPAAFTLVGLGVVVAGTIGWNAWHESKLAEEDEQIRRENEERVFNPPDLTCPDGLRVPLQHSVNRSALTDVLVLVEGDTVKFDAGDSKCDRDMLNIGFHDERVNRLLKRCAIKHLVCDDQQGQSVDITW